nr:immunoglobulin light chain junction region [Macaca mulatta]
WQQHSGWPQLTF